MKMIRIIDKKNTKNTSQLQINTPKYLVIHSTHTYDTFEKLLAYHQSLGCAGVGYHLFIDKEGVVFQSRPYEKEGAHALGFNTTSIGLCIHSYKGIISSKNTSVAKQVIALLQKTYPDISILSHTQAQVTYFNSLFKKYQLDIHIDETKKYALDEEFTKLQQSLMAISSNLSEEFSLVKKELEKIKNCPGESLASALVPHYK